MSETHRTDAENRETAVAQQAVVPRPHWYSEIEVELLILNSKPELQSHSEWITEQLNLAFAKGLEIGARLEREACAKLMESDVKGNRRSNQFCRLADHMQGLCECEERADAIRNRK